MNQRAMSAGRTSRSAAAALRFGDVAHAFYKGAASPMLMHCLHARMQRIVRSPTTSGRTHVARVLRKARRNDQQG